MSRSNKSNSARGTWKRTGAKLIILLATPGGVAYGQSAQPLTLQEAITMAQRQSYQAIAALKSRDAARAQDRRFSASLLPQVSVTGTVPSYNRSIIPVLQPDGSTLFRPQQLNQSSVTMNVSQQLPVLGGNLFIRSGLSRLDLSGDRQSRTWSGTPFQIGISQSLLRSNPALWEARAQEVRADVAERQYLEAREDVAIAVTNAFFDLYSAKVTLENSIKTAAIFDTLYTLNKGRYEVGRIGQTDLQQGHLQFLRAQSAVDAAKLEVDRTLASLRLQLHLPARADLDIVVPSDIPDVTVDTAMAVSQALANSSSIRNLDAQDVDARRRVSEATYNSFNATIQASVGYNQTGAEMGLVYKDLLQAQQYSVAVTMPVWQWGARGAQIEAAKLDQERIASTSRQSREQTALDAHFAALQLAQTRRQYALAAQADTVSANLFDVARRRYVIGRIALQDLLNAQNSRDQAVTAYLQARRGYWIAYYRLRRLTLYDFAAGVQIR
jgi:outer membrane protein TolC